MTGQRPLEGIRVLDLTVALSGPYGTLLLAGLGAEVIKIESPGGSDIARFNPPFATAGGDLRQAAENDDDISLSILARARGKKSVELDLKSPAGREVFYSLVRASDIVFENFSDGVTARLGIDYDVLREVNPALIYCSLSGLGNPSHYPGVKAMDITVQALSGAMDVTGETDGPPTRFGLPISDLLAPLYGVIGIQSALLARRDTGVGQHVEVSMLECLSSLLPFEHLDVLQRSGFPARSGNFHNRLAPFGVYRTHDGYVSIAGAADVWVASIFEALGRPELIDDARYSSRAARAMNSASLNDLIEAWTSGQTTDDVIEQLAKQRSVPCVPVRTALDVLADPELRRRGVLTALSHPSAGPIDAVGSGVPITMSGSDLRFDDDAHRLGADTDEVLVEVAGLGAHELDKLRETGVIG